MHLCLKTAFSLFLQFHLYSGYKSWNCENGVFTQKFFEVHAFFPWSEAIG